MFFVYKQKTAYEMRIRDWSSDVCSSDLWLQYRDLGGEPAFTIEDRLDRFGNTVPTDLVRPEPRHQADDETADDRDHHDGHPHRVVRDDGWFSREPAEPEKVGRDRDKLQQHPCPDRAACADDQRDRKSTRLNSSH